MRKLKKEIKTNQYNITLSSKIFSKKLDEKKFEENLNKNGREYGINNLYYLFNETYKSDREGIEGTGFLKNKGKNLHAFFNNGVSSISIKLFGLNSKKNKEKHKIVCKKIKSIIIKAANNLLSEVVRKSLITEEGLRKLKEESSGYDKSTKLDADLFINKKIDEKKFQKNLNKLGNEYGINNLYYLFNEDFSRGKEGSKGTEVLKNEGKNLYRHFKFRVKSISIKLSGLNSKKEPKKLNIVCKKIKNIIIKAANNSLSESEKKVLITEEGLKKLKEESSSYDKYIRFDSDLFINKKFDEEKFEKNLNELGKEYGINNMYSLFNKAFIRNKNGTRGTEVLKNEGKNLYKFFKTRVSSISTKLSGLNSRNNPKKLYVVSKKIKNIIIKAASES